MDPIGPQASSPQAPSGQDARDPNEEIRRVAQEFEAMVLGELLKPVFSQLDANGLTGGGSGEEMFRPMLVEEYARAMAQAGGVGLADSVMREMTRLQAAQIVEPADGADR